MIKIKAILLFTFFVFITGHSVLAQESKKREFKLDRRTSSTMGDYFSDQQKNWGNIDLKIAYRNMNFMNANYSSKIENKSIQALYGGSLSCSVHLYPLSLDIGAFGTMFSVDNVTNTPYSTLNGRETHLLGADAYLSFFPLPRLWGLSKYISPYIGIGYQVAKIKAGEKSKEETNSKHSSNSDPTIALLNFQSPMCKGGVLIRLGKLCFLYGEYKQTMDTKSPSAYNEWNLGIGFKI